MVSHPRRLSLLAIMCAFALAACAAPAPATPAPAQEPDAEMPAEPEAPAITPEPADPDPADPPPADPQPPIGDGDAALLAMLPASIAGQPFSPTVMTLQQLVEQFGADDDAEVVREFLAVIGRDAGEVSIAFGNIMVDGEFAQISAFHAPGADLGQLLAAAVAAAQQDLDEWDDEPTVVRQATVGGKSVTIVEFEDAFEDDDRVYVYGTGDVVFQINAIPDVADVVLADLP